MTSQKYHLIERHFPKEWYDDVSRRLHIADRTASNVMDAHFIYRYFWKNKCKTNNSKIFALLYLASWRAASFNDDKAVFPRMTMHNAWGRPYPQHGRADGAGGPTRTAAHAGAFVGQEFEWETAEYCTRRNATLQMSRNSARVARAFSWTPTRNTGNLTTNDDNNNKMSFKSLSCLEVCFSQI